MKLPPGARFPTICIHAGQTPDPGTGAIITPIFQTSTYVQEELGKHKGYEYARTQNPTRAALEANIAAIEGGTAAFAFASGMAAIDAITTMLVAGDHVVVTDNTYGGTFRLFDKVLTRYQLEFSYVDTSDPDLVERAIRPNTKMLFVETPTNPVLRLTDIAKTAGIAKARGLRLVVDNTFASPAVQRPLALGADLVTHSTTKSLNGHSDSIGGVVIAVRDEDVEWLRFIQNAAGAILSPFDSFLVLRGTKTLNVRMAQHNANGMALALFLSTHPKVTQVIYPGLPGHPQHELAKRQMRGFGGMVSFRVRGGEEASVAVCGRTRVFILGELLSGVESLIENPATMTHASVPQERRLAIGLTDSLVRISPGSRTSRTLIDDLKQALD
jgi:cystathionine beta-lyase/cystathionine gamma-synthase